MHRKRVCVYMYRFPTWIRKYRKLCDIAYWELARILSVCSRVAYSYRKGCRWLRKNGAMEWPVHTHAHISSSSGDYSLGTFAVLTEHNNKVGRAISCLPCRSGRRTPCYCFIACFVCAKLLCGMQFINWEFNHMRKRVDNNIIVGFFNVIITFFNTFIQF